MSLTELEPWKRQAVEAYSQAMLNQLMRPENVAKDGWEDMAPVELMHEVWYHAAKLLKAVQRLDTDAVAYPLDLKRAVLEFAADVGNCAMIIAEVTGVLDLVDDPVVGENGELAVDWQVAGGSGGSP